MFDSYIKKKNQEFLEKERMKRKLTTYHGVRKKRKTKPPILQKHIVESKRLDFSVSSHALVLYNAVVFAENLDTGLTHITKLENGTEDYQRVGKQVDITSIKLSFGITSAEGIFANNGFIRYIIFKDSAVNGTAPTYAQILRERTPSSASSASFATQPNILLAKRFTIYRDETIALDAVNGSTLFRKFYKKFSKPLRTTFLGDSSAIADAGAEHIFFLVMYVNCTAAPSIVNFKSRIRYLD